MAIRVRKINNKNAIGGFSYVALCAAETDPEESDVYLDDAIHCALSRKFEADFIKEGLLVRRRNKGEK